MPDREQSFSGLPSTVHCWTRDIPIRSFSSWETAIEYCRGNPAELHAIEVFVHNGQQPEPIISGEELYNILAKKAAATG